MDGLKLVLVISIIITIVAACGGSSSPGPIFGTTPTSSPTSTQVLVEDLSPTEAKYHLMERFGGVFFCDPDFTPIGRAGQEEERASEEFPKIQQADEMFQAILDELAVQKSPKYSEEQQLLVYKERKKLNAVTLEPSAAGYTFELLTGQNTIGLRVNGTVDLKGSIDVVSEEPSFNTCPICLAEGTHIATPDGPVLVSDLAIGMDVWTVDETGQRVVAVVDEVARTLVPKGHQMIRVVLHDGRELLASAGHPLTDGQKLEQLVIEDVVDGSIVLALEEVAYNDQYTFDLLPGGATGWYWADDVLIASTLYGSGECKGAR